ncbi:MAG: tripartite tricarboxylate transporter substrate binding protein [Xanthobacteraceae bacterium]|nr:tripartite tricarboxylate transporter substrate binding protein [Xanthobacteraceae bacterium]
MKLPRRQFLRLAASAAALPAASRIARAQSYPSRPVRLIVGFAPSGGNDIVARLIAQWLSARLGQQFIVENRPGAGSNIGTEAVVNSPPDGYTLLLISAANAINASMFDKLNFYFVTDISAVAGLISVPSVILLHPSVQVKTVPEFITYAKQNAGRLSMASGGTATTTHLAGELLKMMADIDMIHVPYRGTGPAITDLLGGQVQVMFGSAPSSVQYIKTGQLRGLAVTSSKRLETLPDIPTVGETVPGYEASQWYGIGVPKATPAPVVELLNKEINAFLADPKIKEKLVGLGGTELPGSPADFRKLIADETEKWRKVVKFANVKPH